MKNKAKRIIRNALLKSSGVIQTTVAGGIAIIDPTGTGIPSEIVRCGVDHAINFIADEFDTRVLTLKEEARVSEVMSNAINKIERNFQEGKKLRNDNFFKVINDKSDAQEVFESIIVAAQREAQEMKLLFYGNLLANIGFVDDLSADECIQIISTAEKLTYRQCLLLLAILLNTAQYRTMGVSNIFADRFIHNGSGNVPYERISLYQEVLELYRMGLVYECKGNLILTIGQINFHALIIGGVGDKIVYLMELDKLAQGEKGKKQLEDFDNIFKLIKNNDYENVETFHYSHK